jgi:hypothetical protein
MALFTRLVALAAILSVTCIDLANAEGSAVVYKRTHEREVRRLNAQYHRHQRNHADPFENSAIEKRNHKRGSCKRTSSTHKAAHTSTSSASLPAGSKHSLLDDNFLNGKKGLAWSAGGQYLHNFYNPSVKVMYTWGATCPPEASQYSIVCASMLWGHKNLDAFKAQVGSHKILMGMNE